MAPRQLGSGHEEVRVRPPSRLGSDEGRSTARPRNGIKACFVSPNVDHAGEDRGCLARRTSSCSTGRRGLHTGVRLDPRIGARVGWDAGGYVRAL